MCEHVCACRGEHVCVYVYACVCVCVCGVWVCMNWHVEILCDVFIVNKK